MTLEQFILSAIYEAAREYRSVHFHLMPDEEWRRLTAMAGQLAKHLMEEGV